MQQYLYCTSVKKFSAHRRIHLAAFTRCVLKEYRLPIPVAARQQTQALNPNVNGLCGIFTKSHGTLPFLFWYHLPAGEPSDQVFYFPRMV